MSESIILWLLWIILQCSAIGLAALLLPLLCFRASPDVRGRITLVGLIAMTALLMIGLLPGEGWISSDAARIGARLDRPAEIIPVEQSPDLDLSTMKIEPDHNLKAPPSELKETSLAEDWQELTQWFAAPPTVPIVGEDRDPEVAAAVKASINQRSWLRWIMIGLIAVQTIAVLRILCGLWSIIRLRDRAIACELASANESLCGLLRQSGVSASVQLAISPEIETPAVVGWRRFTILLPPEYREWTQQQLQAVLAHELAHIVRRDSWWRTLAVLLQSFHFYNPLAHFLTRCYSLEQELGADQLASHWLGDRQLYLQGLAQLALQQSPSRTPLAALPFLPIRNTLVRRLEMLRDVPRPISRLLERTLQTTALGLLLLLTVVIGGLRPLEAQIPGDEQAIAEGASDNQAKEPSPSGEIAQNPTPSEPLKYPRGFGVARRLTDLAPANFGQVAVEVDVTKLLSDSEFQKFLATRDRFGGSTETTATLMQAKLLVPAEKIVSILYVSTELSNSPLAKTSETVQALLVQSADSIDFNALGVNYSFESQYLPTPHPSGGPSQFIPLAKNVVAISDSTTALNLLATFQWMSEDERKPLSDILPTGDADAQFTFNMQTLRRSWGQTLSAPYQAFLTMLSPALDPSTRWIGEIRRAAQGTASECRLVIRYESPEAAAKAKLTLESAKVLLQNAAEVNNRPAFFITDDSTSVLAYHEMEKLVTAQLLSSADCQVEGSSCVITATMHWTPAQLAEAVLPARYDSLTKEARESDEVHMKRIGLALHQYHSQNGHFPPAVIVDEQSGQKRSWRVELLRYLDAPETELYVRYRKDQPWDSEENLRVLADMPAIYRSAFDPLPQYLLRNPDGVESLRTPVKYLTTSYHLVTGAGTALSPPKSNLEGGGMMGGDLDEENPDPLLALAEDRFARFQDCVDGTSNTILFVQSDVNIPWTMPKDVPLEAASLDKLKPIYPAGFWTCRVDGFVGFIPKDLDPTIWKNLLIRDDGQLIAPF